MTKKLKFLTVLAAITAMSWAVAKVASAHGWGEHGDGFQLFGAARLVTGGVLPHNVAVDLTSNCGPLPLVLTPPVCDTGSSQFVFSGVAFKLHGGSLKISDIKTLLTDFNMNGTDCSGGSPRFVILTSLHNYVANLGHAPFGGNCYFGWQNTGNMTDTADPTLRWQIDLANTFVTWSDVASTHGSESVTQIFIVLDGGWIAPRGQDVTVDNFTINKEVMDFSEESH